MKHLFLTILAALLSFASFATVFPFSPSSGTLCVGYGESLIDSMSPGGTWSSSNVAVASIGTDGYLVANAAGVATITYTTGSGFVTGTFTVDPMPAMITGGPTSFCVGSSATFMDATPGGTWSTASYGGSATVNPSTGVVTGVSSGVIVLYYVLGACQVTSYDTVLGGTAPIIGGPTQVCSGSMITLTDSLGGSGITWSSSNVMVATVGASSGVVTGVSNGTVTITATVSGGICGGSVYSTYVVTVGPVATGSVSGSGAIAVGGIGAFYYYGDGSGGTWSISPTSVATIDASGNVTGVSVGTATVTYSFVSCGTTEYATTTVSITSLDGISGYVMFSSGYTGSVKVWLIHYNPITTSLSAIDSATTYCSGTSMYYQFTGLATDSFRIKAAVYDSMGTITTGPIPTYHDTSFYWDYASVIMHAAGTSDINENINMLYGTTSGGPGFIGGNVTTGANRGTSGTIPAVGIQIVILNTSTGAVAGMTTTNSSGNYSFSGLAYGTYMVFPDSLNYGTTPFSSIVLSASSPSFSTAKFIQHTISKTITPDTTTGVSQVVPSVSSVSAFPNPTSGKLTIQWTERATEKSTLVITDITGREVYKSAINMNQGAGMTSIDLSALSNGMYMISVKSASLNYNNKLEIAH